MYSDAPARQYVILRPLFGSAGGFARLEARQGRVCLTIRASQLPEAPLRSLLLCGDADTGAVLDLGLIRSLGRRQGSLYRENLPPSCLGCHTVALCTDWPDAQMLLVGGLNGRTQPPCWQLQALIRQYLSVPAPGSVLPEPLDLTAERAPALCMLLRERNPPE